MRAGKYVSDWCKLAHSRCSGEVTSTDYSLSANSSSTSEEVQEWAQTGPSSMTKWVSWQPDWRLFDFDFLLEWGGRYGPALHQGQWWRWMSWGMHCTLLLCPCAIVVLTLAEAELRLTSSLRLALRVSLSVGVVIVGHESLVFT